MSAPRFQHSGAGPDDLPPDFDRHTDALLIAETGACNPSGIAHTLHHACRQALAEGAPQRSDPAVRLIGLQLAFLLDVGGVVDAGEYARLVETCRARKPERRSADTA